MKYKTSYIIIGILVLLLMYLSIFCKPNINFSTKINTISTQDYQNILNSNQIIVEENKDIDKFKYLSVNVKIKAPYILVKNVKISTSGLEEYLENNNIKIQMEDIKFTSLERCITDLATKLSLSLVLASMVIGSSLIISSQNINRNIWIKMMAITGFSISFIIGILLIIKIFRSQYRK